MLINRWTEIGAVLWICKMINFVNSRPQLQMKERILNTSNRKRITASENSDQMIIFPEPEVIFEVVPRIGGAPRCADGTTFCENFDAYPYNHVRSILGKNPVYRDLFGEDEAPVEISNRVGGDNEKFVCSAEQKTIFPEIGKTIKGEWRYIINQRNEKEGYVQGVRVETCRSSGSPCELIGEVPNGYVTYCKQKYVYRKLLSLNETGSLTSFAFQMPSACCCAYKRNNEFLAKFAADPVTPINRRSGDVLKNCTV